jgi:hypothetical protein
MDRHQPKSRCEGSARLPATEQLKTSQVIMILPRSIWWTA